VKNTLRVRPLWLPLPYDPSQFASIYLAKSLKSEACVTFTHISHWGFDIQALADYR